MSPAKPYFSERDMRIMAAREPRRVGHIYVVKAENALYKIGRSSKLQERVAQLISQSPTPLALILSAEFDDCWFWELELHRRFSPKRKHGEWFELSEEDLGVIKNFFEYPSLENLFSKSKGLPTDLIREAVFGANHE